MLILSLLLFVCSSIHLPSLSKYELVHVDRLGDLPRVIRHRGQPLIAHPSTLQLRFSTFGRSLHLELRRNEGLLGESYRHTLVNYDENNLASTVAADSSFHPEEHCFYWAYHVDGRTTAPVGAFTTCHDTISGSFIFNMDAPEEYMIEPHENRYVVFPRSSLLETGHYGDPLLPSDILNGGYPIDSNLVQNILNARTGVHNGAHNDAHNGQHGGDDTVHREAILEFNPTAQEQGGRRLLQANAKHFELLVVNDRLRYVQRGDTTESNSVYILNRADWLYYAANSFNPPVRLVIVSMMTWNSSDPYTPSSTSATEVSSSDLLDKFVVNSYQLNLAMPAINAYDGRVLLSGYDFNDEVVGLAYLGVLCGRASGSANLTAAIVQTVSLSDNFCGTTTAHELGHNFGFTHDGQAGSPASVCSISGFVMSARVSANSPPTLFSSCSFSTYASWVSSPSNNGCLNNLPTKVWKPITCGDGVLDIDMGETCDCGVAGSTACLSDPCCNPDSCQLRTDTSPPPNCSNAMPCCENCNYVTNGRVCRAARDATCDQAETCSGNSGECPKDIFAAAGTSCLDGFGSTDAKCFNGGCRSVAASCKALFGTVSEGCSSTPLGDPACESLSCLDGTTCTTTTNNSFIAGVPCGSGSQCNVTGQCVSSSSLNPTTPSDNNNTFNLTNIIIYIVVALFVVSFISICWRCCCYTTEHRQQFRQRTTYYMRRKRAPAPAPTVVVQSHYAQPPPAGGGAHAAYGYPAGAAYPAGGYPAGGYPAGAAYPGAYPAGGPGYGSPPGRPEGQPAPVELGGGFVIEAAGGGGGALPPGWEEHRTSQGKPYWFNSRTGATLWERPVA